MKQGLMLSAALTFGVYGVGNSQERIALTAVENQIIEKPLSEIEIDLSINGFIAPVIDADALAVSFEEKLYEGEGLVAPSSPYANHPIAKLLNVSEIPGVSEGEHGALFEFYKARDYEPYFTATPEVQSVLIGALSQVEMHGLPNARYETPDPKDDEALLELQMGAKFLRYANDMEVGIVSPSEMGVEFDIIPKGRSYGEFLIALFEAQDKKSFFRSLLPQDPAYPVLVQELVRLRALGAQVENPIRIPDGETLRVGDRDPRVSVMRARLAQLGFVETKTSVTGSAKVADENETALLILEELEGNAQDELLESQPTVELNLYDDALFDAVTSFQKAAGLYVDGVVGPATLTMMNTGPEDRIRSVLVGLERHRWGDQDRSGRQIYVNIANFMTEIRDDNKKTFETIVVVGKNKEDWRTPEFHDEMTHMVINPRWNVPESISVREYLPQMKRNPGILERKNMVLRAKSSGKVVDPYRVDMSALSEDYFPYRIQQKSGPGNALGKVKFMFPNKHNIYLHDTQQKSLFKRSVRAYSHGCVRVRDPEDFATALLSKQYSDPRGQYKSILATKKERYVDLATPVPVYLTYHTAYLNNSGTISYAPDAYGRDRQLKELLKAKGVIF